MDDTITWDEAGAAEAKRLQGERASESARIPASIAAALVVAQRHVSGVEKSKRAGGDKWSGYKFASAEAIIAEARTALHSAGLAVLIPTWREQRDHVELDVFVVHDSGDTWAVEPRPTGIIVEGKGRPRDKAIMGAMTYATQYVLRGLLQIPRPDEGESVDDRDDRDHEPRRRQRADVPDTGTGNDKREPLREFSPRVLMFAGQSTGKLLAHCKVEGLRAHLKRLQGYVETSDPDQLHAHMPLHIDALRQELTSRAAEEALSASESAGAPETPEGGGEGESASEPEAEGEPSGDEADRLEAEAMRAEAAGETIDPATGEVHRV